MEFVSGPLDAGSFGPNELDATFGPEVRFRGIPEDMKPFRPPSEGYQFFGEIEIDPSAGEMAVRHFDRAGRTLWETRIPRS